MAPKVSIIIPVYNGSNYMREAIDSALAQTYDNYEVLVINDGSDDGGETERIALSYGDRIRYFAKENGGVATALNLGIREMRGEYFSWLSHDDLFHPQKLRRQMEAVENCGDATRLAITDYGIYDQKRKSVSYVHLGEQFPVEWIENGLFLLLESYSVSGYTSLIHKSHFERVGLFDESLRTTQDCDMWFRLMKGQRLLYVPECLLTLRHHSEQGTHTISTYVSEGDAIHTKWPDGLSDEDILSIYREKSLFYASYMDAMRGAGHINAYRHTNRLLQREPVPVDLDARICAFHSDLAAISGGNAERICIFCTGAWGKRMYYELTNRLVHVDCFCDNNPRKFGHITGGTYCISFEELEKEEDKTLVVVANQTPDEIMQQLKDHQFPYVIKRQDLSQGLLSVPCVKWMTALDSLDGVDYSSAQVEKLVGEFRKTVYDICQYYKDKYGPMAVLQNTN